MRRNFLRHTAQLLALLSQDSAYRVAWAPGNQKFGLGYPANERMADQSIIGTANQIPDSLVVPELVKLDEFLSVGVLGEAFTPGRIVVRSVIGPVAV